MSGTLRDPKEGLWMVKFQIFASIKSLFPLNCENPRLFLENTQFFDVVLREHFHN